MMLPGTAILTVHFLPEVGLKMAEGLEVSMVVELCSLLASCFRYLTISSCVDVARELRTFPPMFKL